MLCRDDPPAGPLHNKAQPLRLAPAVPGCQPFPDPPAPDHQGSGCPGRQASGFHPQQGSARAAQISKEPHPVHHRVEIARADDEAPAASHMFQAFEEDEDLLEDVLTETQQAIEMTNISSNILSSMMDAFASIISNNLNSVMKFLASITIIVSLPTLITSFYGMNVKLPLGEHGLAFIAIIILIIVVTGAVGWIFWRHDWL